MVSSFEIISQTMIDMANAPVSKQIESGIWAFDRHTYIWPWPIRKAKVKVMRISTVYILQTVRDRANNIIAIK